VLSLFLSKNSEGTKSVSYEYLTIHFAASNSSVDVIRFLLEFYPESLTMVTSGHDSTLLHLDLQNKSNNIADPEGIVEYLCKLCPALLHMKSRLGNTPLHNALYTEGKLNTEFVKFLCNTDESVVRDKYTPTAVTSSWSLQLPLHLLIKFEPPRIEVSNEGDSFRLFLQLHPASAGVKDGYLQTL
jgi:hypothetical protein